MKFIKWTLFCKKVFGKKYVETNMRAYTRTFNANKEQSRSIKGRCSNG